MRKAFALAALLLVTLTHAQDNSTAGEITKAEVKILEAKNSGIDVSIADRLLEEAKNNQLEGNEIESRVLARQAYTEAERLILTAEKPYAQWFSTAAFAVLASGGLLYGVRRRKKKQAVIMDALEELNDIGGVIGSAVVRTDGLLIASAFLPAHNAAVVGAMASKAVKDSKTTIRELELGQFEYIVVTASIAQYIAFEKKGAILMVLIEGGLNIGLVLNSIEKKMEKISSLIEPLGIKEEEVHSVIVATIESIQSGPASFIGKKVSIHGCVIHEMEDGQYIITDPTGAISGVSEPGLAGSGTVDGIVQKKDGKMVIEF